MSIHGLLESHVKTKDLSLVITLITLFKSITIFCWTISIPSNILHINVDAWEYYVKYLSFPHNIVVNMNNVMLVLHIVFEEGNLRKLPMTGTLI